MITYKDAGVDVEAGYEAVKLMKKHVGRTFRPEVLTDIGGFGGLFGLDKNKYDEPVLVSGTDGVGTKLKIAFLTDRHDTVGIDCVAMCVNDIICSGAEPLFFLDYIALGKNIPQKVADIVKGVAEGCVQAGCALIGGETAEMPGFYPADEYDLAGFAVGIVDKAKIIDGSTIKAGDAVIGLESSGLHSNGFSLVRKALAPTKENIEEIILECGCSMGEELLKPTRIYVKTVRELIAKFGGGIRGISHVTGGGFYENIPRMFPKGIGAEIKSGTWRIPAIFGYIQKTGKIDDKMMFNTFNMGIGMAIAAPTGRAEEICEFIAASGCGASVIGKVVESENGVEIC